MKIMMMNKETDQEVIYNDALGYDTHAAIDTDHGYEPVFQIAFDDLTTATFKKSEWDLFVLKR